MAFATFTPTAANHITGWSLMDFLKTGRIYDLSAQMTAAQVHDAIGMPATWEAMPGDTIPTRWHYHHGLEFKFNNAPSGEAQQMKFNLETFGKDQTVVCLNGHRLVLTNGWSWETEMRDFAKDIQDNEIDAFVFFRVDEKMLKDIRIVSASGVSIEFEQVDFEDDEGRFLDCTTTHGKSIALRTAQPSGIHAWATEHLPQPGDSTRLKLKDSLVW